MTKKSKEDNKFKRIFFIIMALCFAILLFFQGYNIYYDKYLNKHKAFIYDKDKSVNIADYNITDMAGQNLKFSDLQGEKLIVAYWAPWCGYCKEDLPKINELYHDLKKVGYRVVSIIEKKESTEEIEKFIEKYKVGYIQPYRSDDPRLYNQKVGFKGVPNFIVVDEKSNVVANIRPAWFEEDLFEMFGMLDQSIAAKFPGYLQSQQ